MEDLDSIPATSNGVSAKHSNSPILDSPIIERKALAPGHSELDQETVRLILRVLRDALDAGHTVLPAFLPREYTRIPTRYDYDRAINAIRARHHLRSHVEGWIPLLTTKPFESLIGICKTHSV